MKALSIKQPWVYCILHLGKRIENRTWNTKFRGEFLIHASKGFDKAGLGKLRAAGYTLPPEPDMYPRGGIMGKAKIIGCIKSIEQTVIPDQWNWWQGPMGFEIDNVQELIFKPYKGKLGFFECDSWNKRHR